MNNLAEEKRFTYKDYIRWTGDIKYEIIDGVAYAMASPSSAHQRISSELHGRLWQFLRGKPCEVFATLAVRLNADDYDDTVVEPDLFVVCDKSKVGNKSIKGTPDFIIEILSPSTEKNDKVRKALWYRKAGVKEYWIVDPVFKNVQVYILENGKYKGKIYNDDDIIQVHTLDGCEINLAEIFYDVTESDGENELVNIQKLAEVLKANGVSDEQIEKSIKMLDK